MTTSERPRRHFGFRGHLRLLGCCVVALGIMDYIFLGETSGYLAILDLAAIGICVVTGMWIVIKPSIRIGVAAAVALVILALLELIQMIANKSGATDYLVPVFYLGVAFGVLEVCASGSKKAPPLAEQGGADRPAAAPGLEPKGKQNPKPESEGRSQ